MSEASELAVHSWSEAFANAIGVAAGDKPLIGSITPASRFQPSLGGAWFEQRFSDRASILWIYVPEPSAHTIAERAPEMRLVNLLSHASTEFAERVAREERPLLAFPATPSEPPEESVPGCTVEMRFGGRTFTLGIVPNPEAVALFALPRKGSILAEMDLVLDMELPVTVSIGTAKIPLKDVLKLTTGSIVELDRMISDPVDVLVSNCVIARGEVVVIEGNYGVRILEVVSRSERLALRGAGAGQRPPGRQELAVRGA